MRTGVQFPPAPPDKHPKGCQEVQESQKGPSKSTTWAFFFIQRLPMTSNEIQAFLGAILGVTGKLVFGDEKVAPKMKLSIEQIDTPIVPPRHRKSHDGHGLFLLAQPNGARYWRQNYRLAARRKTLGPGVYPDVGLKAAGAESEHLRAGSRPASIPVRSERRRNGPPRSKRLRLSLVSPLAS